MCLWDFYGNKYVMEIQFIESDWRGWELGGGLECYVVMLIKLTNDNQPGLSFISEEGNANGCQR